MCVSPSLPPRPIPELTAPLVRVRASTQTASDCSAAAAVDDSVDDDGRGAVFRPAPSLPPSVVVVVVVAFGSLLARSESTSQ